MMREKGRRCIYLSIQSVRNLERMYGGLISVLHVSISHVH